MKRRDPIKNGIISTRDLSFIRYWFVTIDNDVPVGPLVSFKYVSSKIQEILNDSRGWNKFGYQFKQIDPVIGLEFSKDERHWKNIFHYRISTESNIIKDCNFYGLSCAKLSSNEIFLNLKNWLYGTKHSGMHHDEYIWYLINHETAHLLGRYHNVWPNDPNEPCPVLSQQTIRPSPSKCRQNVFPLQSDYDM
jgi:hypothetical protein